MRRDLAVIAAGGIASLAGILLFRLVGLFSKIILGRLGPEDYGAFSIALAIFNVLLVVCVFGFDAAIARFGAAASRKEIKSYVANALRISIPLSILIAAGIWIFSDKIAATFTSPALAVILRWFALAIPLIAFVRVIAGILAAKRITFGYVMLATITESIVRLAFLIAMIVLGWGLLGGIIAYFAGFVAVFIAALFFIRTYRLPLRVTGPWEKHFLMYALPVFGVAILTLLLWALDTFLLGMLKGAESAGIYNAAIPLSSQILVGALVLMPFFVPTLAARARRKQPLTKIYRQITKWVLLFTSPLVLFLAFFATPIILLLFGTDYITAAPVLRLLAISHFLFAITLPSRELLRVWQKNMFWVFVIMGITLLIDTLLNLLFIPRYGAMGAAIASIASIGLMSATWVVWVRVHAKAWPLVYTHLRVIFASIIALALAGILFALTHALLDNWAVIVALAGLSISYAPLLFLCKALDKQDKQILAGFVNRFGLPVPQRWLE